jgi:gliding motility-associated-like protein
MFKLLNIKILILLILFGISIVVAQPTILYNNGAKVYTAPASILHLNGTFQNDNSLGTPEVFENNGVMTIANNNTSGTAILTSNSILQGNGTYLIEQDWINDATFIAANSTVDLNGNTQQFITSTNNTVTTFNNLILSGTGTGNNRKKTLQLVDAQISPTGSLTINDRELETALNTLFVLNPSPACITNTTTPGNEGFVSSTFNNGGSGYLSRITNSTSSYLYPTGSSNGNVRYRPVIITPASSANNTYTARLGNNDATADGFATTAIDTFMCTINHLYYHEILRSAGIDNANVDIYYDGSADGLWDGIANWNTPSVNLWNNMGLVTTSSNIPLNSILKTSWNNFSNSPYALSRQKPAPPVLSCTDVCANSSGNVFTASGSTTAYNWTSPSGTTITSGQNTSSVSIDWNDTSGTINVTALSDLGCESTLASCFVNTASGSLNAQFTSHTLENHYFNFTDLSTGDATQFLWDLGDGQTTIVQNPEHIYFACGSQQVCLTVSNGVCSDSACTDIVVNELAIIPNVFTPDGDGVNDIFFINNTCLEGYLLEIYNRWGQKIFESTTGGWDGHTTAGNIASDGTYYFIFKGTSSISQKDYSTEGYLSLIRSK